MRFFFLSHPFGYKIDQELEVASFIERWSKALTFKGILFLVQYSQLRFLCVCARAAVDLTPRL